MSVVIDSERRRMMKPIISDLINSSFGGNAFDPKFNSGLMSKAQLLLSSSLTSPILDDQNNYSNYRSQGKKIISSIISFVLLLKHNFDDVHQFSQLFNNMSLRDKIAKIYDNMNGAMELSKKYLESKGIISVMDGNLEKIITKDIKADILNSIIGTWASILYSENSTRQFAYSAVVNVFLGYCDEDYKKLFNTKGHNYISYLNGLEISDKMKDKMDEFIIRICELSFPNKEDQSTLYDQINQIDDNFAHKVLMLALTNKDTNEVDNLENLEFVGDRVMDALLALYSINILIDASEPGRLTELRNELLDRGGQALMYQDFGLSEFVVYVNNLRSSEMDVKDMSDFIESLFTALLLIGYRMNKHTMFSLANNVVSNYWNKITKINDDRLNGPWNSQLNQGIGKDMVMTDDDGDERISNEPRWILTKREEIRNEKLVYIARITMSKEAADNIVAYSIRPTEYITSPSLTEFEYEAKALDKDDAATAAYGSLMMHFVRCGYDNDLLKMNRRLSTLKKLFINDQKSLQMITDKKNPYQLPSAKFLSQYGMFTAKNKAGRITTFILYLVTYYENGKIEKKIVEMPVKSDNIIAVRSIIAGKKKEEYNTNLNDAYSIKAIKTVVLEQH